ncbi:hypothetical protein [Bradyrhizobium sp.]|uniref:hypothetical protein n=1 Tax=Bradyrhizobium sp. TaxID=376 RepID=UPI003C7541AF
MTSQDTLGQGISGNVSTGLPSITVNGIAPDEGDYFPRPWKSRVTSVEAGIGTPNAWPAETNTYTPQQIAGFLNKYIFGPATGPTDELSPFARTLQSGFGTVGPSNGEPPVRFLSRRSSNPLGSGIADWTSSVDPAGPQYAARPTSAPEEPGGLLGMLLDHLRNNFDN